MKALILAAGYGTRLRPLTLSVPKALVPIAGKPLLEYHLQSLFSHGIHEVLINTHYLPEQVQAFVLEYTRAYPHMAITLRHEPELLGSAGTLRESQEFFGQDENILVIYADNFTNLHYTNLIASHCRTRSIGTIACYYEQFPESKGIVVYDADQRIRTFIEKPQAEQIVSNYANAGMYVFNRRIFEYLDGAEAGYDFGRHVFPDLLNRFVPLQAYIMSEYFLDVGSPESYAKAQLDYKKVLPTE